jgi:hypothetical protein
MKKEVVRLSAEARRRYLMLAACGKNKELTNKVPVVQTNCIHVLDLHRIIGLDLAGLEEDSLAG